MASLSDNENNDDNNNNSSNKKAKMTNISTVLSPDSLMSVSEQDRPRFLGDLRRLAEKHSPDELVGPLEATLPAPKNSGNHEMEHVEAKYLPVYVQALKVVTEREPNRLLPFVKRLLVHRKLATSTAIDGLSQASDLLQHFTAILATDIPQRPTAEDGEPVLNEGEAGKEATVYLRKEHLKAVVALFVVLQAFHVPGQVDEVCAAIFSRLMHCDPWRLDNENNDWECWEFSQYAFDRIKTLVPLLVWDMHQQLETKTESPQKNEKPVEETKSLSPIEKLLEWLVFVADKSYYENRSQLVYDLYPVYEQAAAKDPLTAFRIAKEWIEESFSEEGWEWSHKTETMCFLAAKSLARMKANEQGLSNAVTADLPVLADKLLDPNTNQIKKESEDCEDREPLEELHKLLVELLGLTVSEAEAED